MKRGGSDDMITRQQEEHGGPTSRCAGGLGVWKVALDNGFMMQKSAQKV